MLCVPQYFNRFSLIPFVKALAYGFPHPAESISSVKTTNWIIFRFSGNNEANYIRTFINLKAQFSHLILCRRNSPCARVHCYWVWYDECSIWLNLSSLVPLQYQLQCWKCYLHIIILIKLLYKRESSTRHIHFITI